MKKNFVILAFIGLSLGFISAQNVQKIVSVVPGGLHKAMSQAERETVTHLILTGSIDACDFKTMRDNMRALKVVDLSKVSIAAYSGDKGTEHNAAKYKANTIPQNAFFNSSSGIGKRTIAEVIFPPKLEGIGEKAFYNCSNFETVTIPASVTNIGSEAFSRCPKLMQVTAENPKPITNLGKGVFYGIDPNACILYVPKGSKNAYATAKQWKEFFNIEEFGEAVVVVEEPAPAPVPVVVVDTVVVYRQVPVAVKQIFEKALTGIEFETGKDVIKASSNGILDEIANVMVENSDYILLINGHTDNVGVPESNLILSEKRANAVKYYLLGKGIPSGRMIAQGFGDSKPIADNATDAGRQANRRVEFLVKFEK
jgi:outer membrane protein OmpA-like peptidoglycan-associated protein